jgi:tetratricopeptide (TPR) repeat protein
MTQVFQFRRNSSPKPVKANQIAGLLRRAYKFHSDGRLQEAIALCEYILASGFDPPDVHYALGSFYQETQQWNAAIQHLRLLVEDPDYTLSCCYALGQCYRALGDLHTAAAYFDKAVDIVELDTLNIEEVDALIQLCQEAANTHLMRGERQQALALYNALLSFLRSRWWVDKVALVEQMLRAI